MLANGYTAPVIAGLAVGIGFVLIFSLAPMIISKQPVMYLTTTDGIVYKASLNDYCIVLCDFLAFSRVVPAGSTVHIAQGSDFSLRTNGIEQPKELNFYIQDKSGTSNSFDPSKRDIGAYQIPSSLESGEYLIDVLALWNDNTYSFHRFKVNVD